NVMLTVSVFLYISLLYVVSLLFLFFLFFLVLRRPPSSTLFPYTTPSDLIWLGIRTIRTRNAEMTLQAPGPSNGAFRQGILTEVLNPKTALFFLSFIPQFVAPAHGHAFFQFALLGAISVDRKSTRLNSSHVSISYAVF